MDAADPRWRQLGVVLLEAGLLSERDLALALAEQERSGRRLGEILVTRGLVSGAALANALAEQHGGFLRTEHGFGTGLRGLIGPGGASASPSANPDVGPPVSAPVPQPTEMPFGGSPTTAGVVQTLPQPDPTHLLFVPTPGGYLLVQRTGEAPAPGQQLALPEAPNARLYVSKLARSPLPLDKRICAYLQAL